MAPRLQNDPPAEDSDESHSPEGAEVIGETLTDNDLTFRPMGPPTAPIVPLRMEAPDLHINEYLAYLFGANCHYIAFHAAGGISIGTFSVLLQIFVNMLTFLDKPYSKEVQKRLPSATDRQLPDTVPMDASGPDSDMHLRDLIRTLAGSHIPPNVFALMIGAIITPLFDSQYAMVWRAHKMTEEGARTADLSPRAKQALLEVVALSMEQLIAKGLSIDDETYTLCELLVRYRVVRVNIRACCRPE